MNDDFRERARRYLVGSRQGFVTQDVEELAEVLREAVEADRRVRRKMPERSPMTQERLKQIRQSYDESRIPWGDRGYPCITSEFFALVDHLLQVNEVLECECAALCNDREYESRMMEAGVAKALAVIKEERAAQYESNYPNAHYLLDKAIGLIKEVCGPAEPLPHHKSLARLRRLELACLNLLYACDVQAQAPFGAVMEALRGRIGQVKEVLEGP